MPRPSLDLISVAPQARGWDAAVNTNLQRVKDLLEAPMPLALVYKTTPYTGATHLTSLAASDYLGCFAFITDPASVSTNGNLIYSDGTSWKYQRSGSAV